MTIKRSLNRVEVGMKMGAKREETFVYQKENGSITSCYYFCSITVATTKCCCCPYSRAFGLS